MIEIMIIFYTFDGRSNSVGAVPGPSERVAERRLAGARTAQWRADGRTIEYRGGEGVGGGEKVGY